MKNSSRLAATARCMSSTERPTIYLEKYYPIEGHEDFFKWVIVTPNGLAKDYNNEVMYFHTFNFEQAKATMKAIRVTSKF